MLAQANRFHGHGSIRYIYARGDVVRSRLITCKYIQNQRRSTPRVAVVVSKKVLKSAVGRNRIRRRLYECVRLRLDSLPPQSDIVFIVGSSEVKSLPSDELQAHVDQLLTQAGLYKPVKN